MNKAIPVYAIAQLHITDPDTFLSEYVIPLKTINERHGVEVLSAAKDVEVMEGEYRESFTVLLQFPTEADRSRWYYDPDYQPLIKRRQQLTDTQNSNFIFLPAFQGVES